MFLSRFEWYVSSTIMLGAFGLEVFLALSGGADNAVSFIAGGAFTFMLLSWARTHRERRRGWKVMISENDKGIAVGIMARVPADEQEDSQ